MVVSHQENSYISEEDIKTLDIDQIFMIDQAIEEVGEFGEIRLVVNKGRFRFLIVMKSYDAINMSSETLIEEFNP
jgi:hypothetical protein